MRPGVAIAGLALAAGLAGAGISSAGAEPLPAGRLSILLGAKNGTGRLANDIGLGLAYGLEAGYAPMAPTQRWGWGLAWSTVWSRYDGGARISGTLSMIEIDLGVRARVVLGARSRAVLWIGGGGALLRTNDPVLRDGKRDHAGPFGATGVEGRLRIPGLGWRPICGISARYGIIADGQGTLGVVASIGGGT